MLRNKYRAFEIKDDQVSQTLVDGNLCSIAEFIRHCSEGSIITLHTMEGDDDMPAHAKCCIIGPELSIPITNGRLNLGTWQGIYLCEFRDYGGNRKVVATIMGE